MHRATRHTSVLHTGFTCGVILKDRGITFQVHFIQHYQYSIIIIVVVLNVDIIIEKIIESFICTITRFL